MVNVLRVWKVEPKKTIHTSLINFLPMKKIDKGEKVKRSWQLKYMTNDVFDRFGSRFVFFNNHTMPAVSLQATLIGSALTVV